MQKTFERCLALFLALTLILGTMTTAFASETDTILAETTEVDIPTEEGPNATEVDKDNKTIGAEAPISNTDDIAAYIATKLLLSKGYRKIAYLAKKKYQTSAERCQGYISALLEWGLKIDRRLIILPRENEDIDCYQAAKKIIADNNCPDAIFCFNDYVAQEVCKAVIACGKKVSDDIGIIGYDNITSAASFLPSISSVAYKSVEIGEMAAGILADSISGKDPGSNFDSYLFQPIIVERESCRGPKTDSLVHKSN